jgi:hypothetical protein
MDFSGHNFSGIEKYMKPTIQARGGSSTLGNQRACKSGTQLPNILSTFTANRPNWLGSIKKCEVGGVFDAGSCRRRGIGIDLVKAEKLLLAKETQKRTAKLIESALNDSCLAPPKQQHNNHHGGAFPPIDVDGFDFSNLCSSDKLRVRNGPGYFSIEPTDNIRPVKFPSLRLRRERGHQL